MAQPWTDAQRAKFRATMAEKKAKRQQRHKETVARHRDAKKANGGAETGSMPLEMISARPTRSLDTKKAPRGNASPTQGHFQHPFAPDKAALAVQLLETALALLKGGA